MVERAYEQYLVNECKGQIANKQKLETIAKQKSDEEERAQILEQANSYTLSRCTELEDLFPRRKRGAGYRAYY